MRKCYRCKETKNLSEFHKNKTKKLGYNYECKICDDIRRKENYLKNYAHSLNFHKKRRKEFPKIYSEIDHKKYLKHKYNITIAEVEKMKADQFDKCKICNNILPLVIDHNHDNGKIRGLLCHQCNSLLGFAHEDESILINAIQYLQETKLICQ